MDDEIADHEALRREIRGKYRDVAVDPDRRFDFRTGRPLAQRLGYPHSIVDALPDHAVESFAGVSNLWVPKTYATRRYSWMTPPARSCRWTRK
jgi:hypothetical protein